MDRFALFVDAGHLLAEGGSLCCGTKNRGSLDCDYRGLVDALVAECTSECKLPLLRVYWYDAARDAIPTAEQLVVGQLPKTKLRLGRITGGKQKGVDSLIVRDLMTLARERAIATAFLLGGDEDLREGMVAAQEMGVAVNVIGIPTAGAGQFNQAATLVREADLHMMLPAAFLQPFITSRQRPLPTTPTVTTVAVTPTPPVAMSAPVPRSVSSSDVGTAASAFTSTWAQAHPNEIAGVVMRAPVIPVWLDAQLLGAIEAVTGASLRGRDDLRKDARAHFWSTIRAIAAAANQPSPTNPPSSNPSEDGTVG